MLARSLGRANRSAPTASPTSTHTRSGTPAPRPSSSRLTVDDDVAARSATSACVRPLRKRATRTWRPRSKATSSGSRPMPRMMGDRAHCGRTRRSPPTYVALTHDMPARADLARHLPHGALRRHVQPHRADRQRAGPRDVPGQSTRAAPTGWAPRRTRPRILSGGSPVHARRCPWGGRRAMEVVVGRVAARRVPCGRVAARRVPCGRVAARRSLRPGVGRVARVGVARVKRSGREAIRT